MRCRQARRRMNELGHHGSRLLTDPELLEHLRQCPDCAGEAQKSRLLDRLFTAARQDTDEAMPPLTEMRERVQQRVLSSPPGRTFRAPIRSGAWSLLAHRAGVGLTAAAVIVLLAVSALVPFRYDQVVSYQVAFEGVQRSLAENDQNLCDLLFTIGLYDADVDQLSCDSTCTLHIIFLKSPDEAQLVIEAVSEVNSGGISADIIPVRTQSTRTILDRVGESIL